VHGGHEDATWGEMIVRSGKIGDHEIALRIGEHEHEIEKAVNLALHAMSGGLQKIGLGLPGLLADEAAFEVRQCRMCLRTQEKHTPFGADLGINIQGVNEGVDGVGHAASEKRKEEKED
jgi:hypothetical protein